MPKLEDGIPKVTTLYFQIHHIVIVIIVTTGVTGGNKNNCTLFRTKSH